MKIKEAYKLRNSGLVRIPMQQKGYRRPSPKEEFWIRKFIEILVSIKGKEMILLTKAYLNFALQNTVLKHPYNR
jgi:hypothetical protein